jgi:ribonuclease T2
MAVLLDAWFGVDLPMTKWMGFAVLMLIGLLGFAPGATAKAPVTGQFDYFVLALSWSPTYCAGQAGQKDNQQCAPGRQFAFVVHGLWPQYTQGWPENCPTSESWVEQSTIDNMLDVMPSKKLIIHEWKKHGSCAGVSQADYFRAVRLLFKKVLVPARYLAPTQDVVTTPSQLVLDFVKTNQGLSADMISVQCGNTKDQARLSELRICLTKTGAFGVCGENEKRQCQAASLVMPKVR